jgi:hypothetical protein
MLARYLTALYATLRETGPEFSEDECELALVAWVDDSDGDSSLDFHTYALAWRSALREHSMLTSVDERNDHPCSR